MTSAIAINILLSRPGTDCPRPRPQTEVDLLPYWHRIPLEGACAPPGRERAHAPPGGRPRARAPLSQHLAEFCDQDRADQVATAAGLRA